MSNVVSAIINKAGEEDIRNQISMLEVITMTNILSTNASKAYNQIASIGNMIGGFFGKKDLLSGVEEKSLEQQLNEYAEGLKKYHREDLDSILRKSIKDRLGIREKVSDEKLSIMLVDKAAKHMDINEALTPYEKIDAVFHRYSERIEELIRKKYNDASPSEKAEIRSKIDKSIQALTEEERNNIRDALKVHDITADTVLDIMKTTGISGLAIAGGSVFGSYILLSILLHGVFTTLLGITLPFAVYTGAASTLSFLTGPVGWAAFAAFGVWQYLSGSAKVDGEVYCQMIFLARYVNVQPFAPGEDELPSWISPKEDFEKQALLEKAREYEEKEKYYLQLSDRLNKSEQNQRAAEEKVKSAEFEIKKIHKQYMLAQTAFEESEKRRETLSKQIEAKQDKLRQMQLSAEHSQDEILALRQEMSLNQSKLQQVEDEYQKYKKAMEDCSTDERRLKGIFDSLVHRLEKFKKENACTVTEYMNSADGFMEERRKRKEFFKAGFIDYFAGNSSRKIVFAESIWDKISLCSNDFTELILLSILQIQRCERPDEYGEKQNRKMGHFLLPVKKTNMSLEYSWNMALDTVTFENLLDDKLEKSLQMERQARENAEANLRRQKDEYERKIEELRAAGSTPLANEEIKAVFNKALNETQKELDVLSPWLRDSVFKEMFYEKIGRLLDKGVVVKFRYGIEDYSKGQRGTIEESTLRIAKKLKQKFGRYSNFHIAQTNTHGKILISDDKYIVVGSFNFLSFGGRYDKNTRSEVALLCKEVGLIQDMRRDYFSF